MSLDTYTAEEVSLSYVNQNGIFIAHHYDNIAEPLHKIYSAPEGYCFVNIKNITSQNAYVQAKTKGPGDDLTKISGGVWNPSSITNTDWVDLIRGGDIAGNFTQVALYKVGAPNLRIAFMLTLMEAR
tara:strand:- start:59 stop:439 length:381 start_codon:yes stop_codon:yes gene_type:complete